MHKQSLPLGTICAQLFVFNKNYSCANNHFPPGLIELNIISQQELFTVNNNTTVLQTVITDIVNCYRSYCSDYYSCMLFMFLVNNRNPTPVYLAKSEQIVHPVCTYHTIQYQIQPVTVRSMWTMFHYQSVLQAIILVDRKRSL